MRSRAGLTMQPRGMAMMFDTSQPSPLGATVAVQSLADKLQTAFDEIDFSLFLDNVTDPLEKLQRYARGIASTIPEIDQALRGIDLTTVEGRRKDRKSVV